MAFTFDPEKSARNVADRGLSFDLVERLEWEAAIVVEDTRRDYGEIRLKVLALLEGRLYAAVVTPRGEDLRVIEVERYGKEDR
jgi:uncharacterized protein